MNPSSKAKQVVDSLTEVTRSSRNQMQDADIDVLGLRLNQTIEELGSRYRTASPVERQAILGILSDITDKAGLIITWAGRQP